MAREKTRPFYGTKPGPAGPPGPQIACNATRHSEKKTRVSVCSDLATLTRGFHLAVLEQENMPTGRCLQACHVSNETTPAQNVGFEKPWIALCVGLVLGREDSGRSRKGIGIWRHD